MSDRPSLAPEQIVAVIWDRWDRQLRDWDLEGSVANREARDLALAAVSEILDVTPGMALHWQGPLPRGRFGKVWRFDWWPPCTWAWEIGTTPGPEGYIATGNRRTRHGARLAAWRRAWGRV